MIIRVIAHVEGLCLIKKLYTMTESKSSPKAKDILNRITGETKLGDLRKIAKEIKKDHELAIELWSTRAYLPALLATLIMDKKLLSQEAPDDLDRDMHTFPLDERINLMDWLMANQLAKNKKTVELMLSWEHSPSALQRRTFWYYQARLRWAGQTPPDNTAELLTSMEANIMREEPEVQWAMNFAAGWIGVFEEQHREHCIKLGETTGLYKDEKVAKGCTPDYLPEFIAIEAKKRKL